MTKLFYKKRILYFFISIITTIFSLNIPTTAADGVDGPDSSETNPFIAGCKTASVIVNVVNDLHERITNIKDKKRRDAIEASFNYCTKNGYVVYYTAPHRSINADETHPYFYAYPYHVEVHKVWFGDPKKYPGDNFPVNQDLRTRLEALLNKVKSPEYGVPPDGALDVSVKAKKSKLNNPSLKIGGGNHLYFEYSIIARRPFTGEEKVLVSHLPVGPIMQDHLISTQRNLIMSSVLLSDSLPDKKIETTIPEETKSDLVMPSVFLADSLPGKKIETTIPAQRAKGNYLWCGIVLGAIAGETISYLTGNTERAVSFIMAGGAIGGIFGYNVES